MATQSKKETVSGLKQITVVYDTYTEITREADPDERWDGDNTYEHHTIHGVKHVDKWGDVYVTFTPEKNKTYYLLYVLYNAGDSFHREENRISFINLYESYECAELNKKRIEEQGRNYTFNLVTEEGKEYKLSNPGNGYFERITRVEIEEVRFLNV